MKLFPRCPIFLLLQLIAYYLFNSGTYKIFMLQCVNTKFKERDKKIIDYSLTALKSVNLSPTSIFKILPFKQ